MWGPLHVCRHACVPKIALKHFIADMGYNKTNLSLHNDSLGTLSRVKDVFATVTRVWRVLAISRILGRHNYAPLFPLL